MTGNSLRNRLIESVARTDSILLKGIITSLSPFKLYDAFYSGVSGNDSLSDFAVVSFDCDHAADIKALPSLLEILESLEVKCSFACIGKQIDKYPKEHRMIFDRGHEIVNHTQNHPFSRELNSKTRFDHLGTKEMKKEIWECHRACRISLGYEPVGFRIPHFARQYTSSVYGILGDLGYLYSSSQLAIRTRERGFPFRIGRIVEFPVTTCPVHPFQAFDTYHAFRSKLTSHKDEADFIRSLTCLIAYFDERNLFLNLCFDPQDVLRFENMENLIGPIRGSRKLVTYRELVRYLAGDVS